jgi:hypothetical protein
MIVTAPGLVHLLGADFHPACGSAFGFVSTWPSRSTCPTCLALWDHARSRQPGGLLVTDDGVDDQAGH